MTNHEDRTLPDWKVGMRNEKGVILIVTLIVIIAVSIYLPAYVTWTIWDQRSLIREQKAEEARALAQAGLNRAMLDLYMDAGSWVDGWINNWTVGLPAAGNPDQFWTLYSSLNWTLWDGSLGSYTVWIDYLQNPRSCTSGCTFFDKRMRLHSTGRVIGTLGTLASVTLEEYINYNVVKNLTQSLAQGQDILYANLQPAINDAISNNWNNNDFAITDTVLIENININTSMGFTIRGCYAPCFTYRSCSNYHTSFHGNWTVTGGATVNLSGVTIE